MRYVIIGNGMAGVSAASKIRENDVQGHIDIISREDNTFYSRPMLQRFLSGESAVEEIILHDMEWYKKNNLSLVMGEDVGEIDADRKEVKTLSGHAYAYDKLLLASGGYCFVPPIKGTDKAGIFTLSCIADARRIKEYARESKTAVIIGAGPIGLETAAALTKLKLKVTIIEALPRLLPRQLDT
ncbi:MAG: FAD-dependent oxidoreductase, partial [Dehalococcoidia bacterium]|nr:FAD-dependent oxidoreductase [Dehalococcoidia bacterium]